MSGNKKPRKVHRPRGVTGHTMALALFQAAKPWAADRGELLSTLAKAVMGLREGFGSELQWAIVAGSLSVAQAIEQLGVVRGMSEHLQATEQALQDIYTRAMRPNSGFWVRPTLDYQELDALQTFQELHAFQIDQLGRGELIAAMDLAQKNNAAQGHTTTLARDLERLAA